MSVSANNMTKINIQKGFSIIVLLIDTYESDWRKNKSWFLQNAEAWSDFDYKEHRKIALT